MQSDYPDREKKEEELEAALCLLYDAWDPLVGTDAFIFGDFIIEFEAVVIPILTDTGVEAARYQAEQLGVPFDVADATAASQEQATKAASYLVGRIRNQLARADDQLPRVNAKTIAATETARMIIFGGLLVAGNGKDRRAIWITRGDGEVCTVCQPLHGKERSFWQQFFPAGPPAHPNCRCRITYN